MDTMRKRIFDIVRWGLGNDGAAERATDAILAIVTEDREKLVSALDRMYVTVVRGHSPEDVQGQCKRILDYARTSVGK